jgi:hypothetical protein
MSCAECNAEYQQLLLLKNHMENLAAEPLEVDFVAQLHMRIANEENFMFRPTRFFLWPTRFGLVAACIGLFFLTITFLFPSSDRQNGIPIAQKSIPRVEQSPVSYDQSLSIDEPVSVYQVSSIFP